MTIRAVLFDLDGTLVDSLPDIGGAMNTALEALELPTHPLPAYREFVGQGVGRLVERALPPEAESRQAEAEAAFREVYGTRLTRETRPYPGVEALLDRLAELGVPFAVCSNKPQLMTEQVVAELFAGRPFRGVEGQREERPRKPDPAAPLELARALSLSPEAIAFVGDTKTDMQTAVNAGMRPVGVSWGFRDRAELEANGAAVVVDSAEALAEWIVAQ